MPPRICFHAQDAKWQRGCRHSAQERRKCRPAPNISLQECNFPSVSPNVLWQGVHVFLGGVEGAARSPSLGGHIFLFFFSPLLAQVSCCMPPGAVLSTEPCPHGSAAGQRMCLHIGGASPRRCQTLSLVVPDSSYVLWLPATPCTVGHIFLLAACTLHGFSSSFPPTHHQPCMGGGSAPAVCVLLNSL